MILLCPFCGKKLDQPIKDGISSCVHCNRTIDTTVGNKLLSAAWDALKTPNINAIKSSYNLNQDEVILLTAFIYDNGYSIQSFAHSLKRLGIR